METFLMAKLFSQDVLGVDLRRTFPFTTFVLVNFGESGCEIKILAETKKFDGTIAINLLFAALF